MNEQQDRPDWVNYFMGLAFAARWRSHDIHTKHGCIITDRHNHIISTGYNGFCHSGKNDKSLPTNRPDPDKPDDLNKHDFINGTHSERNALFHCLINPWTLPGGAVAYITGEPCNDCLTALWQANVKTVYYADRHGSTKLNERTRRVQKIIVEQTGIEMIMVRPDVSWVLDAMEEPMKLGFIKRFWNFITKCFIFTGDVKIRKA